MNTHADTAAHNSFSGTLNSEEYFPFLRKISRNYLENFRRNIFPEKTTSLLIIIFTSWHDTSIDENLLAIKKLLIIQSTLQQLRFHIKPEFR